MGSLKDRIYYLDSLKVIAIFAVVLIHSASMPLYTLSTDDAVFVYANLLDSFSRFCVPVFFMASGAVLLARDYDITDFYRKRLSKIIPVLIFWSGLYLAFRIFVKNEHITVQNAIISFFDGHIYYHLWFLYVIVILYLLAPFIRRLVVAMSQKEAFLLFVIWLFLAVLLPHLEAVGVVKFGFVYREFGAFSGYFVLGYYLSRMEFSRPLSAFVMFAAASLAIFYLTGAFCLAKEEFVGLFYDYSSPLVLIQGVCMFLLFKGLEGQKWLQDLSKLAPLVFGVYLLHPIILEYSSFIDDLFTKASLVFTSSLVIVKALCLLGLKRFL